MSSANSESGCRSIPDSLHVRLPTAHALVKSRDEWRDDERGGDAKGLRDLRRDVRGSKRPDTARRARRLPSEPNGQPESAEHGEKDDEVHDDGDGAVLGQQGLNSLFHGDEGTDGW